MKNDNQNKTEKKTNAIIRRTILIILGLLIGTGIYFANANYIVGNKLPMPFGYGAAVVISGSMEPALEVGDLIFVKKTHDISVGDIVVYQSFGTLIVHRVIDIEENIITVKGDANNIADEPFEAAKLMGVVVGKIPKVGSAARLLKSPVGIFIILLSAFLIVELSFRRQKNKDTVELDEIREEIERLKKEKKALESKENKQ